MFDSQALSQILQIQEGSSVAYKQEVIKDYWICLVSREVSLTGRKEVLTGKAKFGILGDGKEVPQVALAKAFKKGDFRSGYYRDQTLMFALGLCSIEDYFAQLYADPENDPFSKGRQMNAHFSSDLLDDFGNWKNHTDQVNVSSDVSSTGGQMARALGLALASKTYRNNPEIDRDGQFSQGGNEISFVTIGDASTSEGAFWESMNAAGVVQVPLAVCVWDDGYGISVPIEYQTIKQSISKALSGFQSTETDKGFNIYTIKAWDYPSLCNVFASATEEMRQTHMPCLFHIQEVTQPQGHSTSGSHERYKSEARLNWEHEADCIKVMGNWMIDNAILDSDELDTLSQAAKTYVKEKKNIAWERYSAKNKIKKQALLDILNQQSSQYSHAIQEIQNTKDIVFSELVAIARQCLIKYPFDNTISQWVQEQQQIAYQLYHTHLHSETVLNAEEVDVVPAIYAADAPEVNGYQILNTLFDQVFESNAAVLAFGEDVGKIGDVNQGFAGLQEKHGEARIFDAGIREWTIIGQAIGMSMRGLRPIAEIQYLDYIVYALSPLMDDLATLRYRTAGKQKAPAIIRTRGHRLEGIWHAGSPIGMLLHSLRGIYVLTPRNMTQAAGMYNTLLKSDEPGLIIECLNAYRLKEKMPSNVSMFTVPLGIPDILQDGNDISLITYGSCVRIAQKAIELIQHKGISVELIDVQTLLPFDKNHIISRSIQKTNKVIFLDEDVPGGATAYMMQQVLEGQSAYQFLDSTPVCISAYAHRTPYGSDGDYFTKPSAEDIAETIIAIMQEYDPARF